ncbi:hypothetical protein ACM64Y_10835 [Novispirillum sp. DQ9]|uniref:hypothetical protein n=1 Tax=Novispirillum sp. DQ9 TaxID=3398612 RepID=UPI003C79934D
MLRIPAAASLVLLALAGQAQADTVTVRNDGQVAIGARIITGPHEGEWHNLPPGQTQTIDYTPDGRNEVMVNAKYVDGLFRLRDACLERLSPGANHTVSVVASPWGGYCAVR